ncbi:ABC transporter permease [Syntrophotalea carbinolica]|uniref:ABC transporter permease n=1 Tax=Syntrophotalea carbinolica TaxID=19 RepID=UPI0002F7DFE9|nr:ABC transporter permease [Syntrophotalea carbinolica]
MVNTKDAQALGFDLVVALITSIFFTFVVCVLLALVATTSLHEFWFQVRSPQVFSTVWISLQTSLAVVFLAFFLGFPIAYLLALKDFKGKVLLDTLLDLPIVMPPLVSGLALLILLSGEGLVGGWLNRWHIDLIFTKKGIVLAQLFVAAPFFIKTVRESIAAIPKNLLAASATLNASSMFTLVHLIFPLCKKGIWTGLVMTWARALGEFGATSMVAGCIPQQTETMTVSIYMQAMSGGLETATAIALILMVFSFVFLLIVKTRFGQKDEYPA